MAKRLHGWKDNVIVAQDNSSTNVQVAFEGVREGNVAELERGLKGWASRELEVQRTSYDPQSRKLVLNIQGPARAVYAALDNRGSAFNRGYSIVQPEQA